MIDLDHLEALAKAASDHGENIGEESWYAKEEFICNMLMHQIDAEFSEACTPAAILSLIAEVRALREDKARLDSGWIVTHERDEFGEKYRCERRGNDLRSMIDAARREKA